MGEKFMDVGVVCVPAAFLYENSETMCISDEVLSGWPVEVLRRWACTFGSFKISVTPLQRIAGSRCSPSGT